jgi:hypothetical protein
LSLQGADFSIGFPEQFEGFVDDVFGLFAAELIEDGKLGEVDRREPAGVYRVDQFSVNFGL